MTHESTVLLGGTVMSDQGGSAVSAIAWAGDTVIAIDDDEAVRGISRGDSHFFDLQGAWVLPLGDRPEAVWPTDARLEVGGMADLVVVERPLGGPEPTDEPELRTIALVRGGRVVAARCRGPSAVTTMPRGTGRRRRRSRSGLDRSGPSTLRPACLASACSTLRGCPRGFAAAAERGSCAFRLAPRPGRSGRGH